MKKEEETEEEIEEEEEIGEEIEEEIEEKKEEIIEEKSANKKCELCKENATNICFDCSFYLCDNCFEFLHKKKANSEHKKEEIEPYISIDFNCLEHPKVPMNLFCIKEKSNIYILII